MIMQLHQDPNQHFAPILGLTLNVHPLSCAVQSPFGPLPKRVWPLHLSVWRDPVSVPFLQRKAPEKHQKHCLVSQTNHHYSTICMSLVFAKELFRLLIRASVAQKQVPGLTRHFCCEITRCPLGKSLSHSHPQRWSFFSTFQCHKFIVKITQWITSNTKKAL